MLETYISLDLCHNDQCECIHVSGRMSNVIDKFGRKRKCNHTSIIHRPTGVGLKHTQDGDYDMQGKRLKNVGDPIDASDCVTLAYLDNQITDTKEVTLAAVQASVQSAVDIVLKRIEELEKKNSSTHGRTSDQALLHVPTAWLPTQHVIEDPQYM